MRISTRITVEFWIKTILAMLAGSAMIGLGVAIIIQIVQNSG